METGTGGREVSDANNPQRVDAGAADRRSELAMFPSNNDTCACGDVLDEHVDDEGRIGPCQVEGCECVYFEADPEYDDA